jgi:SAM-dependent methyltransferase
MIQGASVLHFAPETHISRRITEQQPSTYIKADLSPSSSEIQAIDVTRLPFAQNSFDMVICNHVLEHVPDDRKALAELFRVLNPNGYAILQTPYSVLLQNSFCDPSINTDKLRNRLYGQEDHVRIYGRDLFLKIEEAGFELQIKTHSDFLSDIDPSFYGVNPQEDFIFVKKSTPTKLQQ